MAAVRTQKRRRRKVIWMHMKSEGPGVLKRARQRKGYTQRELAVLVKCSQAAIWKLEAGKLQTCKPEFITRVTARLKLSLDDVCEERTSTPELTSDKEVTSQVTP